MKYAHFYIEVTDRKILRRLKAHLKELETIEAEKRAMMGHR
jgi:hypothetical protein